VGDKLAKSKEWTISEVVILPRHEQRRMAYFGIIKTHNPNWLAMGFDHDFIYKQSGLYLQTNGIVADDDLTLFAILKNNKDSEISNQYEPMSKLISQKELRIEERPDLPVDLL
jgi:hypothetical protein